MVVRSRAHLAPIVVAALLTALALTGCDTADPLGPTKDTPPATRVAIGPESDKIDARTIVGKPVPTWDVDWMGAPPLHPADLRGKVVLVRWFTEGCPYCTSTAPSLVAWHRELERKDLRVIGMYHHKSRERFEVEDVSTLVAKLGFQFPVAIDPGWRTLKKWWLDDHPGWTSISFLIDRNGTVRFVHTGGEYEPGSADAEQMRRWIDQLLSEG